MAEIMLQTDNLSKNYGFLHAVKNVTMTIEKGSIVGLVGKNGAGKTTLIRLLLGLTNPTSGSFKILPERTRTVTSVAAIVERPSLYLNMDAKTNLICQSKLLGIPEDLDYIDKTLTLVGLKNTTQKVKNYSLGMKQRLAIAMSLVGKPELLILDEPTNGLDPEGIHDMREIFTTLSKEAGTTMIISSHILAELQKVATEFYIMDKGKIIKHATAEEIEAFGAKKLKITVDDVNAAKEALSTLGEVNVISENTVELSGEIQPTQALLLLAQNNVNVTSIINTSDNLEDFYINSIGGAQ